MVEKFHKELENLKKEVIEMGNLAKEMLFNAVEALKNRDVRLAEEVVSKKREIAEMDQKIEEKARRGWDLNP